MAATIPTATPSATTSQQDPLNINASQIAKAETQQTSATTASPTSYDASKMSVGTDQTVNGLLAKYLNAGSPIMQQAESNARQAANARGLANSSLAVGAAQQAAMNSMLPIAQQDATTNNNAAQFNAGAENAAKQYGATNQQQVNLANQSATNSASQFNAQQSNAQSQFNASQSNDLLKTSLDMDNRTALANIEANYKTLMQANSSAGELYQQAVKNITDIQGNKDMTDAAKTSAISNQLAYMKTGISMISKMDNIPGLADLITFS